MRTGARTVTFLFTDLVGSTELLQKAGDEQAQRIFKAHHRKLREAVESHGGHEVKWLGDGLMVAFDSADSAVKCAIAMQQASRRPTVGEGVQTLADGRLAEAERVMFAALPVGQAIGSGDHYIWRANHSAAPLPRSPG